MGRLCVCSCWIKKYVCPLCKVAFKKMPDRSKHKCVAKELALGTANTTGRTHGQGKGPKKGEAKGKRIHQSATAKSIRMAKPTVAASNPVAESALPHIENYTFAEDVQAEATPQAYALDTPGSTPSSTACSSADTTAVNTPSDYNVADSAYSPLKFAPGAVPEVSLPYSATNSAFSSPLRFQDSNDMDTGNVETEWNDTEKPVFDYLPPNAAGDDAFSLLENPDASYIDNMDIDSDPVGSADANASAPVVVDDDLALGRYLTWLFPSNAVNNDVQHDGLQHGAANVVDQFIIMPEMNTADDNTQHDGPQHIVENATNDAVFALSATHGSLSQDGQAMVDLLPHAAVVHNLETAAEHYFEFEAHEEATKNRHFSLYTHMPRPHSMATILTTGPVVAVDTGNVERALFLWNTPDNMIREDYPARPPPPTPRASSNLYSHLASAFNAD